jgi:hypothetical protein
VGITTLQIPIAASSGPLNENDVSTDAAIHSGTIYFGVQQQVGLALDRRTAEIFDTTGVPKFQKIRAAKIDVVSAIANSADFNLWIDAVNNRSTFHRSERHVEPIAQSTMRDGRLNGNVGQFFVSGLSGSNTGGAFGQMAVVKYMDDRDGIETFGQAFTINVNGILNIVDFMMMRSAASIGTGQFRYRVWSAVNDGAGIFGNYIRGTLLATSEPYDFALMTTSPARRAVFILTGAPIVSIGDVVIVDLLFEPTGGAAADSWIGIHATSDIAVEPDLGTIDNISVYGDPTLQGLAYSTNFLHANAIRDGGGAAGPLGFPRPLRPWGLDEAISFGDPYFSPTIEIPGFTAMIQTGLDMWENPRRYLMLRMFATGQGANTRRWHSSRSGVDTLPGIQGAVLTLVYGYDQTCAFDPYTTPAVNAQSATVVPAVDAGTAHVLPAVAAMPAEATPAVRAFPALVRPAVEALPAEVTPAVRAFQADVCPAVSAQPASATPAVRAFQPCVKSAVDAQPAVVKPAVRAFPAYVVPVVSHERAYVKEC